MTLHLNHCSEIRPSFESGHYGVHSTWGRKHRVPLTYVFLGEISSWGACGNLAYFFNIILGIRSLLKMIWHPCSLLRVPVLKLVFLQIWDGCLRESLELPKVRQATWLLWWGTGDCSRVNTGESGIISYWFGIERTVSHFLVTSVSFYTSEGILGDFLEFHQAIQGTLRVWLGTWDCCACNAGESGLISCRRGSRMFFLELQCEPGV